MDETLLVSEPPEKRRKSMTEEEPEVVDRFCDPTKPISVPFQDVSAAAYKIRGGIERTPCLRSQMTHLYGMKIFFKKEFLQYTGSFKERGARYALEMLNKDQRAKGVIAASAGNHALALAYHGQELNIPITVIMPKIAPLMKIQACTKFGATIHIVGANLAESKKYATKMGEEQGLLYINGYDHPHIIAGQGTMGLEIVEQVPDLDACIIPVGGGGLISGAALAIKSLRPNVTIIGVESEKCPSFSEAMKAGKPVYTELHSTLADGLAVPTVGVNAFETAKHLIDRMIVVKEENIALAILRLLEMEKAVVEGAGATGLAAIVEGLVPELAGKKVVVALCGGNIDTTALGRVIERGLAADGRLQRFVVTVSDRPGSIAELTKLIANLGVSLKDIFHERAWIKSDIFAVQVKVVCETRDQEHSQELHEALKSRYTHLVWGPRY
ncbi:L-threonine ammonia-lyase-like [Mya arenaria]|uniref:L-threonine ammonia-lyase-like n=1 Tax=Mya arenaria TaxID=6604 RepID=UPI0022DF7B80|nr:L-threonine ammonia-lyase-like [Mya arenaria]XP_052776744.1 L-threonine ammonia-lyase-like [Mya arenaria]XP_052776745.1 L-threonine ammonia-lyase-like [Mya arenaria]XP_052776746.1 L-threonine ammonia-lyase-like [Mya arenaria]